MKLKIKVKHLFSLVIALCALFICLQLIVLPRLEVAMAKKHFEQGAAGGKNELLHAIDTSSGDDKWALIRQYMIENGSESISTRFNVIVGDGTTYTSEVTSSPDAPSWTGEEKVKYLEAYAASGPIDGYLVRAAKQLALEYQILSRPEDAARALEQTEHRLTSNYNSQKRELMLARAKIYADAGQFETAERLLTELSEEPNWQNTYLKDSIAKLKTRIMEQRDNSAAASSVSGTIKRSDGQPMAGIGVFLRSSKDTYHSLVDSEPYQTLTDSAGSFSFKGVAPGSYVIYIGLTFGQIDGWTRPVKYNEEWIDLRGGENLTRNITLQRLIQLRSPVDQQVITGKTVHFEWEPVEGAAYYALNGTFPIENGTIGFQIKDHIESNAIELPLDTLYSVESGYSYKKFGDKDIPDPSNLLGFADPSSRFSWSVEAYDADGRLLTRSNGYRLNEQTMGRLPFFYLKERTLTEADQLLLAGRMDEALLEYQADYERDEQDSHSLRMIVKLLEVKAADDKRPLDAASVPYLEKLASIDETGNTLFSLVNYYGSIGNWPEVDRYYGMLKEARQGRVESYSQAQYGILLLKQGRVQEGEAELRQAQENDPSNRFIGSYIASVIYSAGNLDRAEELARQYPERSYYGEDNPDWSELVHGLIEESQGSSEDSYFTKLREALRVCFGGDQKRLEDWTADSEYPAMKAFIKALSKVD
ncbi:carboxypeptidase-like regulatory domain-containing protein [Cohnella lubricantis]|uniref:Carboxypeptidase regulatory-like domain-containing protein n=1 Tax=Cohnella lubricantis TaxID=2163172 RepID=A0A841T7C1_9BACL|nr:carboxypeptidase-like regulatory domain-containing protein [Cohnella lubricantis]MBB6676792.1 carboxypeptidase regulatory-like domain-containing protein [Cohnella lubricantis]MBP2118120.1 tetratricopeptide (TPR) repeat protein [Cohnella lubricantis]